MNQTFQEFLSAFRAACELDSPLTLDDICECWRDSEMTARELAEASDLWAAAESQNGSGTHSHKPRPRRSAA